LSPEEIEKFRGMTSRKAIRKLGVHWWQIPKLVVKGVPDFHALLPDLKPFTGLPAIITELHDRGDRLFIVTSNTQGSVTAFLKQHKIDKYFEAVESASGIFNKSKHIRILIRKYHL